MTSLTDRLPTLGRSSVCWDKRRPDAPKDAGFLALFRGGQKAGQTIASGEKRPMQRYSDVVAEIVVGRKYMVLGDQAPSSNQGSTQHVCYLPSDLCF